MICTDCEAFVERKREQYPELERSAALRGWTAPHPDGRGLVLSDETLAFVHERDDDHPEPVPA